jgi:hypothetical protein
MYSNKFIRKAKFFLGCFIFFLTISFSVYSQYNESDYEKVATTIKVFRVNGGVRTEVTNLSSTSSSPVVLRTGDIIQFNLTQNGYYKYNYKVTTTGGVPRIHLVSTDIIPRDFYANYVSGHGTKSLVFEYVVSESDRSSI